MFLGIVWLILFLLIFINILYCACVCGCVHECVQRHTQTSDINPQQKILHFYLGSVLFLFFFNNVFTFCFLHKIKQIYIVDFYMKLHSYQKLSPRPIRSFLYFFTAVNISFFFTFSFEKTMIKIPNRQETKE